MLEIGRSWPIPWTLAAYVLRATRSIDDAREQLERLARQGGQNEAANQAGSRWPKLGTVI